MIRSVAVLSMLAVVTACAGTDSGASAERAPPPPAAYSDAARPAPAVTGTTVPPAVLAQATPTQAPAARDEDEGAIVVPGQAERQVPAPSGDPRTQSERMADIRAWDQCVMQGQNAAEGDPLRPQLDLPEDVCRTQLGMSNRTAVPNSRRTR